MALTTWDKIVEARERIRKDRFDIERVVAESIVEDPPLVAQPDETLDPRVQKGVEWLDKTIPDWADMISLKTFKISNSINCVLGQIGKKKGIGVYEATAEHYLGVGSCYGRKAEKHGFYLGDEDGDWDVLQESWERAIAARQTR